MWLGYVRTTADTAVVPEWYVYVHTFCYTYLLLLLLPMYFNICRYLAFAWRDAVKSSILVTCQ